MKYGQRVKSFCCFVLLSTVALQAQADHSWNGYNWARTANPFTLMIVDSTTSDWWVELDAAMSQWSNSEIFDVWATETDASDSVRQSCPMVQGKIRVCNYTYGTNGWLGLGSVGIDAWGNIDRGTAKINDSYSSSWSSQAMKNHVMCHEVGHMFGLGHTSEDGSSQGTCMDYSSSTSSQWPNAHDYNQLLEIYASLSNYNSYDDSLDNPGGGDDGGSDGGSDSGDTGSGSDGGSTGDSGCSGKGADKNCNGIPDHKEGGSDGSGGKGKGKKKFDANVANKPPMGVRVAGNRRSELWVAPRNDGGIWVHHVFLVPEDDDDHRGRGRSRHSH